MDILIETIIELLLDGCEAVAYHPRFSKKLRFLLGVLLLVATVAVILLLIICGILCVKETAWIGIPLILAGICLAVGGFFKFRKLYDELQRTKE